MTNSNAFTITTNSLSLWAAFSVLEIPGIEQCPAMELKQLYGPRFKLVIHITSTVALGLFVNWLSDQLKSHPEGETKIENQAVSHDRAQITTIIGEKVIINNYYGEKQPDCERVTEKLP
ncbi:hypothetical protein TA3x_000397 [Tundrisphaera sp. TA3]|uniref:hypothetical protein n=1 Tax=Tundrisphaera sp. TA3 TaxID=3435775 RepID=UPI003EBCD8AB